MRVLLVQTGFLGDTILSTPVITALHHVHPKIHLAVLTTPGSAELLRHDPLVQEVFTIDKKQIGRGIRGVIHMAGILRAQAFDKVYSLHRSARTSLILAASGIKTRIGFADSALALLYNYRRERLLMNHEVLRKLSLICPELSDEDRAEFEELCRGAELGISEFAKLRLTVPSIDQVGKQAARVVADRKEYAVVAPGSVWETKRWRLDGFRDVAKWLAGQGLRIVTTGSFAEKDLCMSVGDDLDSINLAGECSVRDLLAVVNGAKIVVCNDSMTMHVASAFRVPVVATFCATTPSMGFGPWGTRAEVVEVNDLFCKPCGRHGGRRCPQGNFACGMRITSNAVISAASRIMNEGSGSVS